MPTPIGAVAAYTLETAPTPPLATDPVWLVCDGLAQKRFTHTGGDQPTPLFAAIGTTFGIGDAQTTYLPPDLRGLFVRGPDASPAQGEAGVDMGPRQCATPRDCDVGGYEADSIGPHTHSMSNTWGTMVNGVCQIQVRGLSASTPPSVDSSQQTSFFMSSETRPVNCALTFLILADNAPDDAPVGSILYWGGLADPDLTATGPQGWFICDGRTIQPPGGGSAVQLPDLRGRFLRAAPPNDMSGLGQSFPDSISAHQHGLAGSISITHDGGGSTQAVGAPGDGDWGGDTDSVGSLIGEESRPRNLALHHIMRAY